MIKIENVEVFGFNAAMRGARNPMNSWKKSDSHYDESNQFVVGNNDIDLAHRLFVAGTEHRKYLRMLHIQMDITSNQVFWAEWDTYKVCTTRNSCSKMHKIHVKEFTEDDFSHEGIDEVGTPATDCFRNVIACCELLRRTFNRTRDKMYWRAIIELLPEGYNMRSTVDLTYETAANIIRQRSGHKMMEWHTVVDTLKALPYMQEFMEGQEDEAY